MTFISVIKSAFRRTRRQVGESATGSVFANTVARVLKYGVADCHGDASALHGVVSVVYSYRGTYLETAFQVLRGQPVGSK